MDPAGAGEWPTGRRSLAGPGVPPGFRFGVATSGFQTEGGYNGPGQPANNWSWWEVQRRVEPSGVGIDLWNRFEHHLDRAAAMGCNAFRMSIEWARCEPFDGEPDHAAFDNYCRILDACHERHLQPLVALHHFCHPAWLGVDFWLRQDAPERFRRWVETAVDRFAGRNRHWITVHEPNVYAVQSYLAGAFPPGRRFDVASTIRAFDHMLTAHVLAYEAIKERQSQAIVATSTCPFSVYELGRLLVDVLLSRSDGVDRYDLRSWLGGRRLEYHERALPRPGALEWLLRRRASAAIPLEQALPRAVAAVYDSPCERTLDVEQIDYHDPVAHHHLQLPGHKATGARAWLPTRLPWDVAPNPAGLTTYCQLSCDPGLELWIVENGLCNRVRNGRSYPRPDGWDRVRYLKEHLAALLDARDGGVPVTGYYHWTLADDYEWGSYEPRFGIHAVDRERGLVWSETDAMGHDSAGAYRRIVDGLRDGDRSVLL